MTTRDIVRTESNERIDQPDFNFSQWAGRSYSHNPWHWFIADDPTDAAEFVLRGFEVTASGPADSQVHVADGIGIGAVTLPDGTTIEPGAFFGTDSPTSQAVDLSGQPVGTINIYVRMSLDSGRSGTRIFYDGSGETPGAINTRYIYSWDATFGTSSPGDEWIRVASVAWDGATVDSGDITNRKKYLFENPAPTFSSAWGGGNDRNADREQYGIFSFARWCDMLRTQLTLIIGVSSWYTLPTTSLALAKAHMDDVTDPHSASPTWTGTVTTEDLAVNDTATIDTLTVSGTVVGNMEFENGITWTTERYIQTEVPMLAMAISTDSDVSDFLKQSGSAWSGATGGASIAGLEGEPTPFPFIYNPTPTAADYIEIDIGPYMRPGSSLYRVYLVAEADTGDVDITCTLRSMVLTGTGATSSALATDTQNCLDAQRRLIQFDMGNTAVAGIMASASAGVRYYSLRFALGTVTGAGVLAFYKIILVWKSDFLDGNLGEATQI